MALDEYMGSEIGRQPATKSYISKLGVQKTLPKQYNEDMNKRKYETSKGERHSKNSIMTKNKTNPLNH